MEEDIKTGLNPGGDADSKEMIEAVAAAVRKYVEAKRGYTAKRVVARLLAFEDDKNVDAGIANIIVIHPPMPVEENSLAWLFVQEFVASVTGGGVGTAAGEVEEGDAWTKVKAPSKTIH